MKNPAQLDIQFSRAKGPAKVKRAPIIRTWMDDDEIIVDSFAGGGGASSGIEIALDRSPDIAINHDPEAIAMHAANHPSTKHYIENVWQVDPVRAVAGKRVGIMWASPTCFPAGTLVTARRGLVPIEALQIGDEVLTHKSRWRRVIATTSKQAPTVSVRGQGHYGLTTTPDHPFYSKRITKRWPRRKNGRHLGGVIREMVENPYWPTAESMTGKLWATPIRYPETSIPICSTAALSEDFFYFVGRWLGDGFASKGDVQICTGLADFDVMRSIFESRPLRNASGDIVQPRVIDLDTPSPRLSWGNAELVRWLEANFGKYAHGKQLPVWALAMQRSWRQALLDGYVDADGHTNDRFTTTTSVSKALSIGIRLLVASLGFAPCLYLRPGTAGQIDGRSFMGRDAFKVDWRRDLQRGTAFRDESHLFTLVREVTPTGRTEEVFCVEVEDDESYVADGIVVHNCSFFSKARGGALSAEAIKIRALAWIMVRWAAAVKPRLIICENVSEFEKWGPLHRQHTEGCEGVACIEGCRFGKHPKNRRTGRDGKGRTIKRHIEGCPGKACHEDCRIHRPIKSREGETFKAFVAKLRHYYKHVEWRRLRACDFGAPTTRERLFLQASDEPIRWPQPSHGPGRAKPHRTAAECIDWSIPCPSIFERPEPLADKTLARIARGVVKFVLQNPRPFIVPPAYGDKGGTDVRVNDINLPMPTICGNRGGHAIVSPMLIKAKTYGGGGNDAKAATEPLSTITASKRGEHAIATATLFRVDHGDVDKNGKKRGQGNSGLEDPLPTLCAGGGQFAIAVPYLVHRSNGERHNKDGTDQAPRIYDVEKPLSTICGGGNKHAACVALLIKHNGGNNDAHGSSGQYIDKPMDTLCAANTKSLTVAHLVRYNSENSEGSTRGQDVAEPLSTLDTSNRFGVVASHLVKLRGTSEAHIEASSHDLGEPMPTISASGTHMAQVSAFLVRYNGKSVGQASDAPIGTLDTTDRYGLVTVVIDGETYVIADIGMRMLEPRELYRAQGFSDAYDITPMWNGKKLTKTAQIRCVGNSVCPPLAAAIIRSALGIDEQLAEAA